jgi:predicted nucleotidyltransferase
MNMGHPITSIASPLAGRVLEVVSGTTRPLAGREIHKIVGEGSNSGVWKVLNRLEDQGILLADRRSHATYYIANRDHLAWPSIQAIVRLRDELTARLTAEIDGWAVAPLHASIFGSTARGDADVDSDVDLLVVRPEDLAPNTLEDWEEQLASVRDAVRRWTGNPCQTFVVTPSRLAEHVRAKDPLVRGWLHDEVLLAGESIVGLIEAVR